ESYWYEIEQLDYQIPASLQIELMSKMMRRVRRATRWLLRNRRADFQPGKELETFAHGMKIINENLSELLRSEQLQNWQDRCVELQEQGLPEMLAVRSATPGYLHSGLSVVDTAVESKKEVLTIAKVYFLLADHLDLPWFAEQISDIKVENYWQAMARESYMDDLETQLRTLAGRLVPQVSDPDSVEQV